MYQHIPVAALRVGDQVAEHFTLASSPLKFPHLDHLELPPYTEVVLYREVRRLIPSPMQAYTVVLDDYHGNTLVRWLRSWEPIEVVVYQ